MTPTDEDMKVAFRVLFGDGFVPSGNEAYGEKDGYAISVPALARALASQREKYVDTVCRIHPRWGPVAAAAIRAGKKG